MCVEVLSKSYFTTNNANIAAVVVVVLRVAHLHRVVGNARASSVAAARLCPPPPPPRRTSSPAPSGRYQSPWTRSRARPVRTNYWSSMWMLLDATTPAFVWCLPGMMQGGVHARGGLPCTAARRRGHVKSWRWRQVLRVGVATWHARCCPLATQRLFSLVSTT